MKILFKKILLVSALFISIAGTACASGKKDKLFKLIEDGSTKEIKSMLRENKDYVNATRGENKENLLMAALKEDREIDAISILLKYGADPDKKDKNKRNAVSYAAQYSSHADVIEKVIKTGAFFSFSKRKRINRKDKNGKTSWDYARENQNSQMVLEVLNKFGPEPVEEAETEQDKTPPADETEAEDPAEVANSLQTEENVEQPEGVPPVFIDKVTPAEEISAETEPAAESKTVEALPENVTAENGNSEPEPEPAKNSVPEETNTTVSALPASPVVSAPEPAVPAVTPALTVTPAEPAKNTEPVPEVKPYKKSYLFDYAETESDDDPIVEDNNYDPDHTFIENADAKDLDGRTKLMKAAKAGDLKQLENLIYSNAAVNATDNDGWTALMFAARFSKDTKITDSLINNGAEVFAKNNYGVTALKLAAGFNGESKITSILLSKYKTIDSEVRSAFIYAITSGAKTSTLDVFFKKGLNLNSLYDGKTPLMYAAENNKDSKVIGWLLNNGAKASFKSTEGKTAFDYARDNKALPHDKNYWALNSNGAN